MISLISTKPSCARDQVCWVSSAMVATHLEQVYTEQNVCTPVISSRNKVASTVRIFHDLKTYLLSNLFVFTVNFVLLKLLTSLITRSIFGTLVSLTDRHIPLHRCTTSLSLFMWFKIIPLFLRIFTSSTVSMIPFISSVYRAKTNGPLTTEAS